MLSKTGLIVLFIFISQALYAGEESYYCPQNHVYIRVGMTEAQVLSACGPPLVKQRTSVQISKRIPVTQLIYSNLNQGALFNGWTTNYNMWSLPSGSLGINLQIEITNNKITNINLNGSSTNAADVCQGVTFQIGDDVGSVYNACGEPSAINNTYINQPVPSAQKPENWVYQTDRYQPKFSLTFTDGILQAIDKPSEPIYE